MKSRIGSLLPVAVLAATVCHSHHAAADACTDLASLPLPNGTITAAQLLGAGSYTAPDNTTHANLPDFCRVAATLRPSADSDIKIEVWMPTAVWNQKYLGTGNGGYAGSIVYKDLAHGLRRHYAVANTDMGTLPATMLDGNALAGHPERWTDYGHRATRLMTAAAKQLIHAYYGSAPLKSYFSGCSTGGQQALMAAQRPPLDYDGIIAGAPGHNRTHLLASFVWVHRAAWRNLATPGFLPPDKLALLNSAILSECGSHYGGGKADAFINDPPSCRFDPRKLQCTGVAAPDCLTPLQADAAAAIYDGVRNLNNSRLIYPGLPRGSENLWWFLQGLPVTEPAFDGMFRWIFGASWNWRNFDFDRDMARVDDALASILNAMNPDLETFRLRGGKLILYHGWSDPLVSAQDTINYYNRVATLLRPDGGSNAYAYAETQKFARLFLAPGMAHCFGGVGPHVFNAPGNAVGPTDPDHDVLSALDRWVTGGMAPERLIATKYVFDNPAIGIAMTRPLCPYPRRAQYNGNGDPNLAESFDCVDAQPTDTEMPSSEYAR